MFKDIVTDVFFDLDHTLWDFDKNSALTFEKILSKCKVQVKLSNFLSTYVPTNLAFWKLYRENKISKEELRYQRLRVTFDKLNYTISDELINNLSEKYIECLASFNHLFPGAIAILEYLKPRYNLHIITNGFQEVQERKLENSGIRHYFDQIINSEMAGVKKPDPAIFEMALSKANVNANKSIMIGDNLEADILGAKKAGLHALHFNVHKDEWHEYCDIIHDLHEIKSYL
ncbi:MAG: YjjG family noncanonical pyrimidine nucleotidase [Cellulophaga sp.]